MTFMDDINQGLYLSQLVQDIGIDPLTGLLNPIASSDDSVILAPAASARNVIQPTDAAVIPITAKGAVGQTADLQQWQNSGGTAIAKVSAGGNLTGDSTLTLAGGNTPGGVPAGRGIIADTNGVTFVGMATNGGQGIFGTITSTAMEVWTAGVIRGRFGAGVGDVSFAVRPVVAQTADLQQWQTQAGGFVGGVTLAGRFKWAAANEQTTVGAAGGASALPALPTKYLQVVDSAGTLLVVPAYAQA